MIRVNLLPEEFRHKEPKRFKLPPFVSPKGLMMFLGALVCLEIAAVLNLKFFAEHRFDRLQNEYRMLGPSLKDVRDVKEKAAQSQEINRQLTGWMEPVVTWTSVMNDVAAGMEKGLWLTSLKFERREFDLPTKPEADPAAAAVPAGQKAAPAATPARIRPIRGKQSEKERRVVMVLQGRVAVDQEEAAVASRFIDRLKKQPAISTLTEDLRLDEIRRTADSEITMFDFVIVGTVKREHEKDFFNLP